MKSKNQKSQKQLSDSALFRQTVGEIQPIKKNATLNRKQQRTQTILQNLQPNHSPQDKNKTTTKHPSHDTQTPHSEAATATTHQINSQQGSRPTLTKASPNNHSLRLSTLMQNTKDRPQSSCQNGLQAQLTELKFSRNGEQNLQFKHLKQGKIKIQDHIDLHGKTVLQAKLETLGKILHAYQKQHRCVCLVHGKGINSPNQDAPIKFSVDFWLRQVPFVEAFCSCLPRHGGTGAIYILLKTNHFANKTLTFSNLRSEDLF